MTISIQNAELTHLHQLPDNIQSIVQLIPDAQLWLNHIIEDQEQTVAFSSTAEFVENLAIGLRNSSLVYLSAANLTADVEKLLAVNANDLRDLVHLQSNSSLTQSTESASMIKTIEHKYRLINNDAFSKISEFFQQYNLNIPHIIWSAEFSEQIELYQVLNYCDQAFVNDPDLSNDAGNWAGQQAQNLSEFAHYYCIYVSLLQKNPQLSQKDVDSLIAPLRPYLAGLLDSPVVTFELDKYALNQAITQWQEAGNMLGFSTLTAALLGTVLNMPAISSTEPLDLAKQYIQTLQQQLKNSLAAYSYVNQAGTCRHYQLDLGVKDILLNVDTQGCLSVSLDFPKPTASSMSSDNGSAGTTKDALIQEPSETPKPQETTSTEAIAGPEEAIREATATKPVTSEKSGGGKSNNTASKTGSSAKPNPHSSPDETSGEEKTNATSTKKQHAARKRNPKSS